jgi:hypothetical protein
MTPSRTTRFVVALLLVGCLASSCGLLLYPDRRGQDSGRIDPVVVVLDSIGLLFWVVPGLVAFAVDIYTGTIYYEPGEGGAVYWPPSADQALLGVTFEVVDPGRG